MSRRFLLLTLLALANLFAFAVAEAAPSGSIEQETIVAVVDTGVSLPGDANVLAGIDLVRPGTAAADENGHGTAVAASIAADCGGCAILPVRVLSRTGTAPWSRVAAGIVWAVDSGARVVNVSIAGPAGSRALRDAVAYATDRGVLVVASAGNGGDATPQYPAAYSGVVAVAATDASGRLADWSSRGAWVDLTAAGCGRTSQRAWACGTSFAAPKVSAQAASLLAGRPSATVAELAASLAAQPPAAHATLRVTGRVRPGSTLQASLSGDVATPVRWYRCAADASPHGCVAVSAGAAYRVRSTDGGSTLVARAVTTRFGGLWLASSPRLAVR
jgi:subtilisin family serine protease